MDKPRSEGIRWELSRQVQFGLDLVCLVLAFLMAYLLRFDFVIPSEFRYRLLVQLPYVVLIQFLTLFLTGIYTFVWRYIGLAELGAFLKAALYSATPLLLLRFGLPYAYRDWRVPLSVIILSTGLAYGGILMLRVLRRMAWEQDRRRQMQSTNGSSTSQAVFLIGAGQAGLIAAREISGRGSSDLEVRGFIDDDAKKLNSVIHGIRVIGTTRDLPRLCAKHQIRQVILTMNEAARTDIRRILDICDSIPVQTRVIPGLYEVLDGRVEVSHIRSVEIEDLLGREPVDLEEDSLQKLIGAKRVLITGAGGTIGAELAVQTLRFRPRSLILADRSEYALFQVEQRIARLGARGVYPVPIDIRDTSKVSRLLENHRPQVILHAAAYKHVPMMEFHVSEAVENNSLATANLARQAGDAGVEAFVLVSSDKAVRPTSIMGASKRVAEIAVQDMSRRFRDTRFLAVRFGNVLGSTGSVVPIFRQQIAAGGPVTVTHPSVTRYFMTPAEAAQLVLQAAAIAGSGEILILDMGEPVSIADLARDMIRLSGLKPFDDIDIVYTGLRPGEKLYEELELSGERTTRTPHSKIFVGRIASHSPDQVDFALRRLTELAQAGDGAAIRAFLTELIPESELSPETPTRDMDSGAGAQVDAEGTP